MPSGQKIKHFFLPLRQVCRVAPSLYSTLLHRQGSASAERHARVLAKDGESRTLACSPAAAAPERSPARPWSKRPGIADRAKQPSTQAATRFLLPASSLYAILKMRMPGASSVVGDPPKPTPFVVWHSLLLFQPSAKEKT